VDIEPILGKLKEDVGKIPALSRRDTSAAASETGSSLVRLYPALTKDVSSSCNLSAASACVAAKTGFRVSFSESASGIAGVDEVEGGFSRLPRRVERSDCCVSSSQGG